MDDQHIQAISFWLSLWDQGIPPLDDADAAAIFARRRQQQERETAFMSAQEIKKQGEELGIALRLVTGNPDPQSVNVAALQVLALKFAQWEGYRDVALGMQYMQGFIGGFRGETLSLALQLDAPKDS